MGSDVAQRFALTSLVCEISDDGGRLPPPIWPPTGRSLTSSGVGERIRFQAANSTPPSRRSIINRRKFS